MKHGIFFHGRSTLLATVVATSTLIAGAGSAYAQKATAKYNREATVKIDAKDSDKLKAPEPKKDTGPAAPEVTSDDMMKVGVVQSKFNKDKLPLLMGIIEEMDDSDIDGKAELMFYLADIYSMENRTWRLAAVEAEIKYGAAKAADKPALKKKWDEAKAKADENLIGAIKAYRALIGNPIGKTKYKKYKDMDKALFYYAFMLQQAKVKDSTDKAREAFDVLIKDYPKSGYIPEAHLSFAEYHFEKGELALAEDRYTRVLQFPKSPVFWYAFYKLGWVQLNLNNHKKALEIFSKVALETRGDKSKETLNKAAKKDVVRAFAEAGRVQDALKYFTKIDKDYAPTMYELLADLYFNDGKTEQAVYAYRELMEAFPKSPNVCLWQYYIARSMMGAKIPNKQKAAEIENLVNLYGALKSTKVLPPDEAKECHDNAADMSGEQARAWHSESVTTHNGETLEFADKLYNVYLKQFPDADDYGVTQYYYAELLWTRALYETNPRLKTELWENAAIEFTAVVKAGKTDEKIKKVAAEAAVMGWKNALDVDPRKKLESAPEDAKQYDKVPEPLPIPEREQKMIDAFDVYINYIKDKKDPELVAMKFNKANLFRRYNRFDDALPIFEDILTNHRDHETALFSANLLLDSLNRLGRFDQMLKWVDTLLADEAWLNKDDDQQSDKAALRDTLEILKRQSLRKRAEQIEGEAQKSKDLSKYVACGTAYTEIYNRDENADDADEVLYNAAVCFEDGKSLGQAISMYNVLIKRFGTDEKGRDTKNPNAQRALLRLGSAYARVGFYDKAADYLGQYGLKFAGEEKAKDAVNDSVFYLKGIGSDDKAIDQTKKFVATFGKKNPRDAAGAFFSLYSIYEKRGDSDMVVKHLRQYIGQYAKVGGPEALIMAYAKIGQTLWQQSCGVKTVDGSCVKVTRDRAVASLKKGKKKRSVQTQCGPASKVKINVVERDAGLVKQALAAFDMAAKIYDSEKAKITDAGAAATALYWAATAKFHQVEKDYEAYLGMAFPTGLDFSTPEKNKKSMAVFEGWLAKKNKASADLVGRYLAIVGTKEGANAVAAGARIGQVAQNYTDALYTAEIPAAQRNIPEAVDAYCDALTKVAEPAESISITGFTKCLETSTSLGYFSEWSRLCERELGQIQPDRFPTAAEIRGEPNSVSTVTAVEAPDLSLE